ncbi:terminase small subunit [Pectinatus frisingensis]|uniref:terminase small subunit n=1 Tax=Pectinatus frisingensis TaxID=865 RepID=UPI0018C82886
MKHEDAYQDYCAGMKYKEIAEKYNIKSVSTVKSWATRYWKVATKGKKLQPEKKKVATNATKKNIKKKLLDSVDENGNLTEKRRFFCLYYATSHNATQSYLKAYGGNKNVASVEGCKLLKNPNIAAEVKRLRDIIRIDIDVEVSDLLRYCLKIVGTDIGDYLTFGTKEIETGDGDMIKVNTLLFGESSEVDTSIIDEVKKGKDGISIKMADKKWAWDKIEKYFGWSGNKQVNEEQRLRIEKLKAEVNTLKADKADSLINNDTVKIYLPDNNRDDSND